MVDGSVDRSTVPTMPALDSIKVQQSHLHALALKPTPESTATVRAVKPSDDPLSQQRILARVNQPSSTLEKILHRQESVRQYGINE
jgi:hypothetical protein